MSDPYDTVSVHGVWPLVADPGSPGGLRLADPARDAPGDCVASPGALPDLGIELRMFPSRQHRDGWCAAAAEFAGNALHVAALPVDAIPAALVIRFDRPRPPGDALDDCVVLVGSPPADLAEARRRGRLDRGRAAGESAWQNAWATELAAVPAIGGLRLDWAGGRAIGRLALATGRGPVAGLRLEPRPGGRRATLVYGVGTALDEPDLERALREAAAGLGYGIGTDGLPAKDVPVADAAVLDGLMADAAALDAAHAGLRETKLRRADVRRATEGEPGAILARLAAGFPVAKAPATSGKAYQVDPATGAAVEVDEAAFRALWRARAVRPGWWAGRVRTYNDHRPLDAFVAGVWVASPLGRDLAAGALDAAAAVPRMKAERVAAWRAVYGPTEPPDFAALAEVEPDRPWRPPDGVAAPSAAAPAARRPSARDLALLSAWTVHGLMPAGVPSPGPAR